MKSIKVKSKKYGTISEVKSYDSKIDMFYCFIPHLDMHLHIHPSAFVLDLGQKGVDNLKQEMVNEKTN